MNVVTLGAKRGVADGETSLKKMIAVSMHGGKMKCLWEICEHLGWDGNTPVCIHGIIDRANRHECNKFESIIERIRKNLTGTNNTPLGTA